MFRVRKKFGTSGLATEHHHIAPGGSYSHSSVPLCTGNDRHEDLVGDPECQPKSSHYLNPNCVLLSYFSGDTSAVVDEHFTRALSQPSSFNLDRNFSSNSFTVKSKAEKPLMCQRKFPPSFWNSAYKPTAPQLGTGTNFDYSRDPYFPTSWYSLQNNWPYRLPSHSHADLSGSLPYSSFDAPGKFGSTYQSLMFPGSYDTRQSKFDFAKNMESLAGTSGYYGLSRLGMDFSSKGNVDPPVSGLEYQLQTARRELCW
ncbi:transcription cofactor vestigial-like protein 2 isoform X2 [Ostrea edulis]|uniref:transcription cofactor vestigial-like protein 2 isoform X2 n=1 Tax=Ostrea edulis TaxID=37623 RepID=UPI002094D690|nr:transcription cofactor vestigial-like protein 2 isoform X2 [Ostrea edulis]